MEGENPTRRYKWFRPRQAMRGYDGFSAPTNYATIGLYNNSRSTHVLVLRDIQTGGGHTTFASPQDALPTGATVVTTVNPVFGLQAALAGQVFHLDSATLYTNTDWDISNNFPPNRVLNIPFAVINPGQCLLFQSQTRATFLTFQAIWEAITIEELDFLDW